VKPRSSLAPIPQPGYYDAYYLRAQKKSGTLIRNDFTSVLKSRSIHLSDLARASIQNRRRSDDPLKMYLADIFTIAANLPELRFHSLGFAHVDDATSRSALQLLGNLDEARLLNIAHPTSKAPIGINAILPNPCITSAPPE